MADETWWILSLAMFVLTRQLHPTSCCPLGPSIGKQWWRSFQPKASRLPRLDLRAERPSATIPAFSFYLAGEIGEEGVSC